MIKVFTAFSGYDSQCMALDRLKENFPNFDYELVRSGRRSISVEIKKGGRVIVRAPQRMSAEAIKRFLCEKSAWIEKHLRIQPEMYVKGCG